MHAVRKDANGKRYIRWVYADGVKEYEIIEATEQFDFFVKEIDVTTSLEKNGMSNANYCVGACAVRRSSNICYFLKDIGYILRNAADGVTYAYRYRFSKPLHEAVKEFDKTGIFALGHYWLNPPTHTQTLNAKAARPRLVPKTTRVVSKRVYLAARGQMMPEA